MTPDLGSELGFALTSALTLDLGLTLDFASELAWT
jgi:hypothetical protein